jgi:hypothetical protein
MRSTQPELHALNLRALSEEKCPVFGGQFLQILLKEPTGLDGQQQHSDTESCVAAEAGRDIEE